MANILQQGETGYGILIERDAGYVSLDLNKNILNEEFKLEPNKPLYIDCILQKWGVENKNGRIYPEAVLVPQVNEYQKLVDTNSAVSEADHPDSSVVSLHNISHMLTKMWWGQNDQSHILFGTLKLIISPGFIKMGIVSVVGDKILLYLQNGIRLGISSRGVGSLEEINGKNMVQNDFELVGFDLVATPSTPGAYLYPHTQNIEQSIGEHRIEKKGKQLTEGKNNIVDALNRFLL